MTSPTDASRLIPLAGTVNFRDVGGYQSSDGRFIRWGRLYRADSLNNLTDEDRDEIRHLGVATVIDLRSSAEVESGRFPIEDIPVDFHHLPLVDEVADPESFAMTPGLLAAMYVDMLDEAGEHITTAIEVLANPASQPAIIHCTAGKDRTGVLIALILGLLGISEEVIVEDYAMSAKSMHKLKERLAERYPDFADQILAADDMFSAAPANMENLLTVIDERWGSIEGYADHLGISPATIERLRSSFLVD